MWELHSGIAGYAQYLYKWRQKWWVFYVFFSDKISKFVFTCSSLLQSAESQWWDAPAHHTDNRKSYRRIQICSKDNFCGIKIGGDKLNRCKSVVGANL